MVCSKIVCVDRKPEKEGYLFFGDNGKYHRIDKTYYPKFKQLSEISEANTWFMNEIDYTKDSQGWEKLPEHVKRMFLLNITYQTLMDNAVPNIFFPLSEFVTDSWLSYLYGRIGVEENIHKLSYSSGMTQVFEEKATEYLDIVYEDPMIRKRMEKEIEDSEKVLNRLYLEYIKHDILNKLEIAGISNETAKVLLNIDIDIENDETFKKDLIRLLIRVFLLEGIKFPHSFFVTWSINKAYDNAIQGFSHLLKLIAWDELTIHTVTGKTVIKILRTENKHGFKEILNSEWFKDTVYDMVKETVDGEVEWSKYLLQDGSIQGYNEKIAEHFIKYWADVRLKELGFEPIYKEEKSTVINWYNEYRNLNKSSNAPQESDTLNYQKGKMKNDLNKLPDLVKKLGITY